MNFITPTPEELSCLRLDPLLWEQQLDVRPEVAESLEKALGFRAGRQYWQSSHDYLYALELADTGTGRPGQATIFGLWDRYEPRPPEHQINRDLLDILDWVAEVSDGLDPADTRAVAGFAAPHDIQFGWPEGSVLRTPDDAFDNLPDFPYEPQYTSIEGLRLAHVEAGAGEPILMLHGQPTWGFLYRKMIPPLSDIGRVIVPDLIGFGRSDKPTLANAYSYLSHVRWVRKFIEAHDLSNITLIGQDWGSMIGLRVLAQIPDRFARLVVTHGGIPDGSHLSDAFHGWRRMVQRTRDLDVPHLMNDTFLGGTLSEAEAAAYGVPFPSAQYQTGLLMFPRLVPCHPQHPGAYDNRVAIETLKSLPLPVFLPWGDQGGGIFAKEEQLRYIFKNVAPPLSIEGGVHFIQEEAGEELAAHIVTWMTA